MTKKRIVTLMMAMLLLISTIVMSLASCTSNEVEDENTTVSANDNVNENEEEKVYSMPKLMSFSAAALERSATGSIDVNVSATVLPVDAQVDKSVDWTVKWADSTKTEPVSDYLTVTPTSDGSANAKISCFKAFEGDIIITVKTRAADFYDTCTVTFIGKPTALSISTNSTVANNSNFGSYYSLGSSSSYKFNINASNAINQLGDLNYDVQVKAHGSIVTKDQDYNTSNDNITWIDGTESTLNLSSITQISKYEPTLYDISLDGNVLTITVNCTLEDYYSNSVRTSSKVTYSDKFYSYSNDSWYYEVIITETTSGLTQSFKFRPVKGISSVDLAFNTLSF